MENWGGTNPVHPNQTSGAQLQDSELPSGEDDIVDKVKGSKHDDNLGPDDGQDDASEDEYEDDFD